MAVPRLTARLLDSRVDVLALVAKLCRDCGGYERKPFPDHRSYPWLGTERVLQSGGCLMQGSHEYVLVPTNESVTLVQKLNSPAQM